MNRAEAIKWIRTAAISSVSGGVMAAIAAACDPTKYSFPRDLGSGKLWPFFLAGAGAMFAGALLRSPLGQSAMQSYQDARAELEHAKQDIDKAKAALKPPSGPGT